MKTTAHFAAWALAALAIWYCPSWSLFGLALYAACEAIAGGRGAARPRP